MKKIIISATFAICSMHAMDIQYTTKSVGEKAALISKKQPYGYSESLHSFTYNIVKLPKEIRIIVYQNLFEIDKDRAEKIEQKILPGYVLRFFYEVQEHCPLQVGNKKFGALELITLSKEQRNKLIEIGNPGCISRLYGLDNAVFDSPGALCSKKSPLDYEALKNMPSYITKDLKISMINDCTIRASNTAHSLGWCGMGVSGLLTLVTCCLGWNFCGLVTPCIAKETVLIMLEAAGGFIASEPLCACIDCMLYRCCAGHTEHDLTQGKKKE